MKSAKEVGVFPYKGKTVCYFAVDMQGNVSQIRYLDQMAEAYARAVKQEIKIYAVWPGNYRSDLFEIDDLNAFADAFGVERPDNHKHDITSALSSGDDGKSTYAYVDIIFNCGCEISENNIRKIANDLKLQKGWDVTTSTGFSSGTSGGQTRYTVKVRRGSYK